MTTPKTKRDVFNSIIGELGEDTGSGNGKKLMQMFERDCAPGLTFSKAADEVLTDEEYNKMVAQIRKELPQIKAFLSQFSPQS